MYTYYDIYWLKKKIKNEKKRKKNCNSIDIACDIYILLVHIIWTTVVRNEDGGNVIKKKKCKFSRSHYTI